MSISQVLVEYQSSIGLLSVDNQLSVGQVLDEWQLSCVKCGCVSSSWVLVDCRSSISEVLVNMWPEDSPYNLLVDSLLIVSCFCRQITGMSTTLGWLSICWPKPPRRHKIWWTCSQPRCKITFIVASGYKDKGLYRLAWPNFKIMVMKVWIKWLFTPPWFQVFLTRSSKRTKEGGGAGRSSHL